jgi:GntR family transcriptional regulator, transcriptional repressor for pyruvate dehydrogenase complex
MFAPAVLPIGYGLSGRTVRGRVWRGLVERKAGQATIDEHRAIYLALKACDPSLASAAASCT